MKKLHSSLLGALIAMMTFLTAFGPKASIARADPGTSFAATLTPLRLENGWTNAPFSTSDATVSTIEGVVHFKGAIAGGTSSQLFTLPAGFRPATAVYVPVNLCNATKGRLFIEPSGRVTVQAQTAFSTPQCFTSLDGASFALSTPALTPLALQNGWTNAPFGTSDAAVTNIGGIVHFKGAIAGGTSAQVFTLPVGFRPTTGVYVPVDLCSAARGRLFISPNGQVTVQAETAFSSAQCFTSLDGASFALSTPAFTVLTLQNGWTNAPFGTSAATVTKIDGVVHFKGAIAGGTSPQAFTLPEGFRPATVVYVPVDLCNATKGRLSIQPSGDVLVQVETAFSNAQCFTSLDGASFVLPAPALTPLTLQNGWTNAPFGTSDAAVTNIGGIVHFKGAIAGGTSPQAFTLPVGFRPTAAVYVPVDLCSATKGRLFIEPSGQVTVQAETAFSSAQCFTSLDGASFVLPTPALTPLALQNGWTNAPFGTSDAAVTNIGGIVHFKGAIAGGTSAQVFTLPVGLRPLINVYVPVDLCGATRGRLFIPPTGQVTVQAETAFSSAQCFTSLDGASFVLSPPALTPLALQNGWTNAPFGTGDAAVTNIDGIVRLRGAISGGTSSQVFTLPVGLRPATVVYIPVDLCNATKGRLFIEPSGQVSVQTQAVFSNAQCFTSLDGASFAR